jgi:hypothetical protein
MAFDSLYKIYANSHHLPYRTEKRLQHAMTHLHFDAVSDNTTGGAIKVCQNTESFTGRHKVCLSPHKCRSNDTFMVDQTQVTSPEFSTKFPATALG